MKDPGFREIPVSLRDPRTKRSGKKHGMDSQVTFKLSKMPIFAKMKYYLSLAHFEIWRRQLLEVTDVRSDRKSKILEPEVKKCIFEKLEKLD